ncbi:hypothetical protein [Peredibacter starrii]|uniref:Uncharacterized protein n=1 Tax=Peredibacter starrii TaxID=28202 RepID=A0AAX4HNX8_9BACT|nr:hypothetical protein [Peredibacter starrii]WPU65009.1 hypothetical protein SOO65_20135 [Peredibacter starrii]
MKFLLLVSWFVSSQVFALDLCQLRDTYEFDQVVQFERLPTIRTVSKNFSDLEKRMIHQALKLQPWQRGIRMDESLRAFGDLFDGYRGPNPGEIVYYQVKGQKLALVHYFPGENEYGAFFLVGNGTTKMVARVDDSEISCSL